MKTIYAYYQSLVLVDQSQEFAKANLWKESWTRAGWNPVMLNSSHAQISPARTKLVTRLMQEMPSLDPSISRDAVHLRFARLCALHAAGGGWLADYDVLNLGFTPKNAEEYEKNSFAIAGKPAHLIFISNEIANAAMQKLLNTNLVQDGQMLSEQDFFNPFEEIKTNLVQHLNNLSDMKEKFLEKN